MNFQDAMKNYFKAQLGVSSGSYVELAAAYYQALLSGEIDPGGEVSSDNITDATAIGKAVLVATSAAAARTAIGAGTSNVVVGTAAANAKAGNWVPAVSDVTGLQAALDLKATVAALTALTTRVQALEDAAV